MSTARQKVSTLKWKSKNKTKFSYSLFSRFSYVNFMLFQQAAPILCGWWHASVSTALDIPA